MRQARDWSGSDEEGRIDSIESVKILRSTDEVSNRRATPNNSANELVRSRSALYRYGFYVGKILHSPNYPIKAPDYIMLTPNGRFEINKKICLTTSGFHQDHWVAAAWNLTTLLQGFSSIWHSDIQEDKVGISHIPKTPVDRLKTLAKESLKWNIKNIPEIFSKFPKMKKYI